VNSPSGLDVIVNVEHDGEGIDVGLLRRAVERTMEAEGAMAGEVSLTLLSDDGIRDLNRRYLGRDRPTDVIAFTLSEGGAVLGDVYIGLDQAARQAGEAGVGVTEELVRLAVHGTLHLMGYDHPEGDERLLSPMFDRQERLVRELLTD
jgi:probable rRNA maturation factor